MEAEGKPLADCFCGVAGRLYGGAGYQQTNDRSTESVPLHAASAYSCSFRWRLGHSAACLAWRAGFFIVPILTGFTSSLRDGERGFRNAEISLRQNAHLRFSSHSSQPSSMTAPAVEGDTQRSGGNRSPAFPLSNDQPLAWPNAVPPYAFSSSKGAPRFSSNRIMDN